MMKGGQSIFRSRWFHYLLAFVLVVGMLIVRLNLPVGFGERPLLILFILPVIISALIGGLGPGIAATILASAITAYNMPPAGKFAFRSGHDLFQWIILIIDGLVVSFISEWLHSMRHKESSRRLQIEAANAALQQSEEKYKNLIDNIPQRIFVKDKNRVYVSCNEHYAADLGIQTTDICGKTDHDFYPADLAEKYRADDARVMESGHTMSFEENYKLLGRDTWIYTIKAPIIDKNGNIAGILGIFSDITEKKQAEKMLAHSHDLMHYIIEHANSAVAVHDRDLKYIYVSQRYMDDYNVKEKNIIGKHHYDVFPDLPQKWRDVHQRVLAGEILSADRDSYPRADGSIDWTRWECRPWYESDGSIGGIILYTEVITNRVLADEELRKSLEYRKAIISASPLAIVTMDPDGIVQSWNSAAQSIFGWTEKEAVGSILPYVREAQMENFKNLRMRILNGEAFSRLELTRQRKDGSPVEISLSATCLRNSEGKATSILAIIDDITEQKRLQAQLAQAQKMESIGRLAGGVAHDFNNKLGVILGYAELAINKAEPDSQISEHLKQISIAAQRSAEITRQLLAFARKQTILPKMLNLNETIYGMIKMLHRLIGENIELAWLPGKDLWLVTMDPAQIDQILVNLCVNSKDAISCVGKITIETNNIHFSEKDCSANKDITSGNFVQLSVSDTGCGMGKETISNLFEPFYTTKEIGKGTGLGLATVYGIVKQNNGFINVYSEPGKGTTFRIYFPAHKGQETLPTDDLTQDIPMPLGNEKILLVEDEPSLLKMSATMLEMLGYTVFTADTPAKAIQIAGEHGNDIQLLITDVIMPEMNGKELSKMLLALYPEMKLIFMSGYTADAIAHHGVLGKDVHFIQKPFSVMDLAAIVKQALGKN